MQLNTLTLQVPTYADSALASLMHFATMHELYSYSVSSSTGIFLSRMFSLAIEFDKAGLSPSNLDGSPFTAQQSAAPVEPESCADTISIITIGAFQQQHQPMIALSLSTLFSLVSWPVIMGQSPPPNSA